MQVRVEAHLGQFFDTVSKRRRSTHGIAEVFQRRRHGGQGDQFEGVPMWQGFDSEQRPAAHSFLTLRKHTKSVLVQVRAGALLGRIRVEFCPRSVSWQNVSVSVVLARAGW